MEKKKRKEFVGLEIWSITDVTDFEIKLLD